MSNENRECADTRHKFFWENSLEIYKAIRSGDWSERALEALDETRAMRLFHQDAALQRRIDAIEASLERTGLIPVTNGYMGA